MTEFTGTAISERAKQAWRGVLAAEVANAEAHAAYRDKWFQFFFTRGFLIPIDNPDYPLVLAHDYGCEVTA